MTLVLLALAAAAMAGLSRSSLARALQARSATEDLQRKWGVISCRTTLLPRVEPLLEAAEARSGEPTRQWRSSTVLGGQRFGLLFSDEQAKLDVNAALRHLGRARAQAAVDQLLRASGVDQPSQFLAGASEKAEEADGDLNSLIESDDLSEKISGPVADGRAGGGPDIAGDGALHPLRSFGQVFPASLPEQLAGVPARHFRGTAALVTCWGDGRLNFSRADPEAIRHAVLPALTRGQLQRLLDSRENLPGANLGQLMAHLQLPEDVQDRLDERLCDDSVCHSLWILAETRGRSWYHLAVSDGSTGDFSDRVVTFDW